MSPRRRPDPISPAAQAALRRMAVEAGQRFRDERMRRHWTLRELAERSGIAPPTLHALETGDAGSLETYARVGTALQLRPSLAFEDARSRGSAGGRDRDDAEDFVHAAMGESEARALARPGRTIAIDEPYQHYQFAGRADVLAWDRENLLHIENRTRFPNIQEAAGAWNAKRRYLARALGERVDLGPRGWRSVTHVMAGLWSSEVLHVLRLRRASFAALCPDPPDAFQAWLAGDEPPEGVASSLVVLDPLVPFGSRRRTVTAVATVSGHAGPDPRYRGYAEAAEALRRAA
jgi:transcriptional regulator with XRE-family HTH domain